MVLVFVRCRSGHTRNIDVAESRLASSGFFPTCTPCSPCYKTHRKSFWPWYQQHLEEEQLNRFQDHIDSSLCYTCSWMTDLCGEVSGPVLCSLYSWPWCHWCRVHSARCTLSLWHPSSDQTGHCRTTAESWWPDNCVYKSKTQGDVTGTALSMSGNWAQYVCFQSFLVLVSTIMRTCSFPENSETTWCFQDVIIKHR